jgi:hypothetical protein
MCGLVLHVWFAVTCGDLLPYGAAHCSHPLSRYNWWESSHHGLDSQAWPGDVSVILGIASDLGGQGSNEPPMYASICIACGGTP